MWGFGGAALVVGAAALFAELAGGDGAHRSPRRSRMHDGGSVVISRVRPLVRRPPRRVAASRVRRSTRCFPTTGRSCWARSRCTASSILVAHRRSTSASSSSRATRPSCTTAATDRCAALQMSQAYESTIRLSFDVRAGLVMRQMHHWAALVFVADDRRAPLPHLLHRRVPQAARDQLGRRRDAADPRDLQRLRRLLAPRRPAVGHRAAHRLLHRARDPGDRHLGRVPRLRRRVPGPRHPLAALRDPRPADPGRDRRACSACTSRSCGARSTPSSPDAGAPRTTSSARSCGRPTRRRASGCSRSSPACSRCSAASRRSTRSGSTGRSRRRRSPPPRNPTGTWDGSRAPAHHAARVPPPRSLRRLGDLLARDRAPGDHLRAALPLAVPRTAVHPRPRRTPRPRPPERTSGAHRARGRGPDLLLGAAPRRRPGHLGAAARRLVVVGAVDVPDPACSCCPC